MMFDNLGKYLVMVVTKHLLYYEQLAVYNCCSFAMRMNLCTINKRNNH